MATVSLELVEDALIGVHSAKFELIMLLVKSGALGSVEKLLEGFVFANVKQAAEFVLESCKDDEGWCIPDYEMELIEDSFEQLNKKDKKFLVDVLLGRDWLWNTDVDVELKMMFVVGLDGEGEVTKRFIEEYEPDVEYESEIERYFLDAICEAYGSEAPTRLLDVYWGPPDGTGWLKQLKEVEEKELLLSEG